MTACPKAGMRLSPGAAMPPCSRTTTPAICNPPTPDQPQLHKGGRQMTRTELGPRAEVNGNPRDHLGLDLPDLQTRPLRPREGSEGPTAPTK